MSPAGKIYWRSLDQLAGTTESRSFLEREFPEGASELPADVPRRTMLMLIGASLSMAGLTSCRRPVEKIVPYVQAPQEFLPGQPLHYATTMPFGLGALGVVVESHEGRPSKIEGNELHPASGGASNVWMQASILDLYDPDRSRTVVRRDTAKGAEPHEATEPTGAATDATWADFAAAWAALEPPLLANGGEGLGLLIESFSSPTLSRLLAAFRVRFPRAQVAVHEPIGDESIFAGIERAAGRPLRPLYHLERADVVVALDSDFLLTDSDGVRHSRGFADRRRVRGPSDSMNRLYAAESVLSLTGSNADHRLRLQSGQIPALVALLAEELRAQGLPVAVPAAGAPQVAGIDRRWLAAAAQDLLAHRGSGLVLAGRRQPASVHAAVLALNAALENVGRTVDYYEMSDAAPPRLAELTALAGAMREGRVGTLVILGGNAAYSAPADLEFGAAAGKVGTVIHLGTHENETAALAAWRLPQAHFLESWADACDIDGTLSIVQPLIEPLFGGRSTTEVLGLLATGVERPGYELVRETWLARLGATGFEDRWSRALHDGVLAGSADAPFEPSVSAESFASLFAEATLGAAGSQDLEIVFQASPALFDGRFANNGWLVELPDPLTKLTWDNAALLSPATARELGVTDEQLVRLSYRGRTLELPVLVVPAQADHSVAVHLGWGRRAAGRIGSGRGFDAYALRTSQALDSDRGLQLAVAPGRYLLSRTQDHGTMVEPLTGQLRPVLREATLDEYRAAPEFAREQVEHPPLVSPWKEHAYDHGYQWGMSIDLNACTGCNACIIACQSENNIPIVGKEQVARGREMHWLRIDRYFSAAVEDAGEIAAGSPLPDAQVAFQPMPCMHCENAPCEQVCPVAATVHDAEGLNAMVYNRCIGTRYCSNNCPYKVRRFNFFNYTKDTPELLKMANNPDVTVRSRGVMEKCTYCVQRISAGKIQAKLDGRPLFDGEIQTACQQACPTRAIVFGDLRDPASEVVRLKGQERDYVLLEELNNRPRTSYLAKLRNPHPELMG